MEPTKELIDALYREELLEARQLSPERKLLLAGELFDELCARMRDGIRSEFPGAEAGHVEEILNQRLDLARRLEHGE